MVKSFQASPITVGGRQAVIEEKRTTTRGNLFDVKKKLNYIS